MLARPLSQIGSLIDWLLLLHGWRRGLVAFLFGAASALAMPPVFAAPVLILTLPGLVFLLDGADADPPRRWWVPGPFFLTGWTFGFGFFLAGLYWIGEALLVDAGAHGWLIPFALVLIPGGLALFVGLATSLAGFFWTTGFARAAMLATLLTAFEALRGIVLTGFPWNGFHSALGIHDALLQGFAMVGPTAASLLVLLVAVAPLAFLAHEGGRRALPAGAAVLLAFGAWAGFGALRLAETPMAAAGPQGGYTVRIVQPNIAQREKWDPELERRNFGRLLELSTQRTRPDQAGLLATDLVVWPESAFPFLLTERPDALAAIGSTLPPGTQLIAGAIRSEPRGGGRVFTNAIFALSDAGEIVDAYDKARLVPFGEMLPFGDLIDRLGLRPLVRAPAGFVPGPGPGTLAMPGAPVALGLVCYEAIFPGFVREGVRRFAPDYLLNVTNDAWFGTSAGPHQHLFQARLRAVETGLPLVRAANTGISAVIDANGRIVADLALGQAGVVEAMLPTPRASTLYRQAGPWPAALIIALVLSLCVYRRLRTAAA